MSNLTNFIWLDVETTGLNPEKDAILEVGVIITDYRLVEIARKSWVFPLLLRTDALDPFIQEMHGKSGLLNECLAYDPEVGGYPAFQALAFISEHGRPDGDNKAPLCGNSVDFDKGFLKRNGVLAGVFDFLSYRVIDVSTIKELSRRWAPSVYESRPPERKIHRAIPDLEDSIAELRHYQEKGFITKFV